MRLIPAIRDVRVISEMVRLLIGVNVIGTTYVFTPS